MKIVRKIALFILALSMFNTAFAQTVSRSDFETLKAKVEAQDSEINSLRNQLNTQPAESKGRAESYAPLFMVLFLFGTFCAVWAQNAERNVWLWFFSGLIFNVFAAIAILVINSNEN